MMAKNKYYAKCGRTEQRAAQWRTAERRSRELRWRASGRACVTHPRYGSVVVPHSSNFAAILNAAEHWGCDWLELRGARVWAVNERSVSYDLRMLRHHI